MFFSMTNLKDLFNKITIINLIYQNPISNIYQLSIGNIPIFFLILLLNIKYNYFLIIFFSKLKTFSLLIISSKIYSILFKVFSTFIFIYKIVNIKQSYH